MKNDPTVVSFRDMEWDCEMKFKKYRNCWHLYTNGHDADVIFADKEDMKVGMNLMAVAKMYFPDIVIFTFELMNNHIHVVLAGERCRCEELFAMFKSRLWKYFTRNGRTVNLSKFNCQLIEIESLQSLRNEIVYVNRNGYVARPDCTPFSYPWGAGAWFFNPLLDSLPTVDYNGLTIREKRRICRSNDIDLPSDNVKVFDGFILPSCFCRICEAESFFRSAHHYFQQLTRKFEAYGEIAARLHESVFIADEEMYAAVCLMCMKSHGVKHPGLLSPKDRIDMAKEMKQKYNASNRQIRSILKLDKEIVEQLFPL